MKRILLISCLFVAFFSCKKDDTRTATVYSKAIEDMGLTYNKTYIFYVERNNGTVTTVDSDRVLFRSNGTVSEVSSYYDWTSHTYPDTLNYAVNTSFDNGINWMQIPDAQVFSFYPVHDTVKGYLMHDFLNTGVVAFYKIKGDASTGALFRVIQASSDSTAYVSGYLKKY